MSKAFVVGAGLMGAAVVAAAAFAVLVFAGLFTVSSGVGGGHRPVTLVQQPPATTTPPPSPSDATDPNPPSDSTATFPPSTTAQTGRSPLPSSNRVAVPARRASSCAAAIDIERFGPIGLGVVARSERRACPGHADDIGTRHEPSGAGPSRTQQVGRSRVSRAKHDRPHIACSGVGSHPGRPPPRQTCSDVPIMRGPARNQSSSRGQNRRSVASTQMCRYGAPGDGHQVTFCACVRCAESERGSTVCGRGDPPFRAMHRRRSAFRSRDLRAP